MDMANWQNYRSQVNGMPAVFTANIERFGCLSIVSILVKLCNLPVPYREMRTVCRMRDEYEKLI